MHKQLSVWHHLAAAPHRPLFLVGALQGILTMLWWVFDLVGRYGVVGASLNWQVTPMWAHGFLMVYGFFPFFIFGFLFTTYPNWMNGEKIQTRHFVATCFLLVVGVILFYFGLITNKSTLIFGVGIMLAGWSVALYALLQVLMGALGQDKRHAKVTSSALVFGWLGVATFLLWLVTERFELLNFSRVAGIWFFLLPIVVTVSHRMIPFFSSRVLDNYVIVRPYWILWLMLACSIGHGILQLLAAPIYLWLFDLPLAFCALYLSFTWGLLRSFRIRLLAVLHISFAWLGLSMLLYGMQSLILMQSEGAQLLFGLAPLHALAIGFFASMVLGMVSRVTIGHSGRPLVLDNFTWLLFVGFQAVVLLRVIADIITILAQHVLSLYLLAGIVWLVCFMLWAVKYVPVYWRQRDDGKPG